ncbi:pilus assembly protein TadG-related protein [Undibacterium arcticum]
MGFALDLGRLYVVRTELQNAADAAALAGAKDLDQTQAGVNKAVATANAIAGQNRTSFFFLMATRVSQHLRAISG